MSTTLKTLTTQSHEEMASAPRAVYEASLDALSAQAQLAPGFIKPPVRVALSRLTKETGIDVHFFSEVLQTTGAFKINGAFNFMRLLDHDTREQGVITASAGNHAAGVAAVAAFFGVPATLVMPQTTPQFKVDNCIRAGDRNLQLNLVGQTFDEAASVARQVSEKQGLAFVPPYDHLDIIAGQAVIGHHILGLAQDRTLDSLYVPVGGGGLIAGISEVFREKSSRTKIVGVEPEGANAMARSLEARRIVELADDYDSTIDGAAVRRPGLLPFEICLANGVGHRTVSYEEVCQATVYLRESGVDALAAELVASASFAGFLRDIKSEAIAPGSRVGIVISGGQLSPERYENEVKKTVGDSDYLKK